MTPWAWQELAAALRWADENAHILEDAHWAVPAQCKNANRGDTSELAFPPYAIGSWRSNSTSRDLGGVGFILLRNPRNMTQDVPAFSLSSVLELPSGVVAQGKFNLEIVRRISPITGRRGPIWSKIFASTSDKLECKNLRARAKKSSHAAVVR